MRFELDRLIVFSAVLQVQLEIGAEVGGDSHPCFLVPAKNEHPILYLGITLDHPAGRGLAIEERCLRLGLNRSPAQEKEDNAQEIAHSLCPEMLLKSWARTPDSRSENLAAEPLINMPFCLDNAILD